MTQPKQAAITIITVVFNGAETLESTIQSVINLGREDVRYIVIDGGSKDGTVDVIKRYQHAIDDWVSEPDKGIYDAMNKGWNKADPATSILFLGSGDTIEKLPSGFNTDQIVYGTVRLGDNKPDFVGAHRKLLKIANTLHHQALLVPKKFAPDSPFNLQYKVYADFDFNQRLLKAGHDFVFSEDFIAYALPEGVSARLYLKELVEIVMRNFGVIWALVSWLHGIRHLYLHRKA